jgi:hypothetical protein
VGTVGPHAKKTSIALDQERAPQSIDNLSLPRISRVMRFAEVKAEAAGRGTRSKAHRPADSLTLARTALMAMAHEMQNSLPALTK